jgi:hypothetical protein
MALSRDALQHFKAETLRGREGFFRVGQSEAGQWWLLGPDDLPCFARAVNGVQDMDGSFQDPIARLRSWGFNALGVASAAALRDEGMPFVGTVGFLSVGPVIRGDGIKLPDVFAPDWRAAAEARASEVCSPMSQRRDLLGWLADDDLDWGGHKDKPSLLQVCLSLEPSFAAYHAAWEFVLAPHGGQLVRLAKAWGFPLENKGVIREVTRAERSVGTAGHFRDDARWTREFAQRYVTFTSSATRSHAPNHLMFGAANSAMDERGTGVSVWLAEIISAAVDVVWMNTKDIRIAPSGPLFAGNFSWVEEPRPALKTRRARAGGSTSLERMLRHGRASLRAIIAHPSVVGYAWKSWRDHPAEQPPFASGLVHINDAEAREHTELLADLNGRTSALRPFALAFSS